MAAETDPLASADKGFPIEIEALLASMFDILKEQGDAREIAILRASHVRAINSGYDNWNGGTDLWALDFSIDLPLFSRLSPEDRRFATERLNEVASQFFSNFSNDRLDKVTLSPRAVANPPWRAEAEEFLTSKGINNQGRVRSDNIASLQCDGLLFRPEPEINLYRAFKAAGVTFAPLPVFLKGGHMYARLA